MNGYQEKSTHFHRWKILFLFCPCIWWYNLRIEICKRNSGKKYTGCGFLGGIRTWSLLKHFVNIKLNLVYFLDCGWKKISATTSVKLSQRVKSKGGVGCNTEFTSVPFPVWSSWWYFICIRNWALVLWKFATYMNLLNHQVNFFRLGLFRGSWCAAHD